ncbi:MAG: HDIG domain-containing protein [Candidatus Kapaibacterium sp.]
MAKTKPTLFEQLKSEEAIENPQEPTGVRFSPIVRWCIIIITLVSCTALFPSRSGISDTASLSGSSMIGLNWPEETLKANFTFPIYKSQAVYQAEVKKAREFAPPVFTLNPVTQRIAARNADAIIQAISALSDDPTATPSLPLSESNSRKCIQFDAVFRRKVIVRIDRELLRLLNAVYQTGFLNISRDKFPSADIAIKQTSVAEQLMPAEKFLDSASMLKLAESMLRSSLPTNEADIALEIAVKSFIPNLLYSSQATEEARKTAELSVPKTLGLVRSGEIIISKGERISENAVLKIQSYGTSRLLHGEKDISWVIILGNLGHTAAIYSILLLFLFYIRRAMFNDNLQLAGLSSMMLFVALQAWATLHLNVSFAVEYAVIIPTLSMLFAILFDSRTAFYATVAMALLLAGIRGNDYSTAVAMMLAGMFAAYTVRDLQSRTQIFKSIFSVFLGFALPIAALGAQRTIELPALGSQLVVALINSAISPLITYGMLFLVERTFNIVTDLRLQEYDNLDHPLMVELSEKAPGTYQHTLTIARLSEAAARAIGANALLAKVGAYYHDIGKIAKSEYFVENQINIDNKHDRLHPRKSASVIREHVEEGIELAQEYKLPRRISDFIPMHHGTMLIKHFYAKALEEAEANGGEVNEEDYRYPGPKPATRETAIVMLADAAEALTRARNDDDRDDFEQTMDSIIRDRLLDGQFDTCDLTMKDLLLIKEAFVKNLVGIHHHRIQYKPLPGDEANDSEHA